MNRLISVQPYLGEKKGEDHMNDKRRKVGYRGAEEITGLAVPTLYSKVNRKEIPHFRLGPRCVVFDVEELSQWVAQRHVAAAETPCADPGNEDGK